VFSILSDTILLTSLPFFCAFADDDEHPDSSGKANGQASVQQRPSLVTLQQNDHSHEGGTPQIEQRGEDSSSRFDQVPQNMRVSVRPSHLQTSA
jgi:hypothetical protein